MSGTKRKHWSAPHTLSALILCAFMLAALSRPDRVGAAETESFTIQDSSIILIKGKTYRLKTTGGIPGASVKWKSSKPGIVKVSSSGKLTAKKKGSAKITAVSNGETAVCTVKVVTASLNHTKLSLAPDGTSTLKLKGTSQKAAWSSSNPAIATVNKKGKVTAKKAGKATIYAQVGQSILKCAVTVKADRWSKLLTKYENNDEVRQLVFVKYTGGSKANVYMYDKTATGWKCILKCAGYVGQNGIGKQKEGDRKTPTGTFSLTQAYGIKDNPGAKMSYVKVNQYLYWCGDPGYYNQLIDIRKKPHTCHGEHLIDYVPHYNYGMFLDYNKNCIYKKGSAIFLHCTGSNKYTGGCIAVSESNMIKIIQNAEPGAKICIYKN